MRAALPLVALTLAGCAARSPLDFIPREDLLMMEAAERMEAQSPQLIRNPPARDLAAEFAAARAAAGVDPAAPAALDPPAAPDLPPPPRRPVALARAPQDAAPAPADPAAASADPAPAPADPAAAPTDPAPATAPGPISVEEMLARVRARTEPTEPTP